MHLKLIFFFTTTIYCIQTYAQNNKKVIWDADQKIPVPYAAIKSDGNYAVSNEKGEFFIDKLTGALTIQRLGYQKLKMNTDYFQKNDTILMKPLMYELQEVALVNDSKFRKMINTILTDYALEPHQESFFLRAI